MPRSGAGLREGVTTLLGVDRAHDEANALRSGVFGFPARARVAVCSSSGGAVAGDFRGSEKIFLIGAKEAESRA